MMTTTTAVLQEGELAEEEFEPLFDYRRVQPKFVCIDGGFLGNKLAWSFGIGVLKLAACLLCVCVCERARACFSLFDVRRFVGILTLIGLGKERVFWLATVSRDCSDMEFSEVGLLFCR